ncbi:hypothetical protein ABT255_24200 [Streptomyces mirabilis]|uniref:hypothetical protein n=1 Tax=Streptomyces mirabilis TaxID=68239 RepID=UPI00331919CE
MRRSGASSVVMPGGLAYFNHLSQWNQYRPGVPNSNLAASWHSSGFNARNTASCWNS